MKTLNSQIKWNDKIKLIISDVDETVADLYLKAKPSMINELISLLKEDKILMFVTGQSLQSLQKRIINFIPKQLKYRILVAHCSGAEIWGFKNNGKPLEKPFYSLYEKSFSDSQKIQWRKIIRLLIEEFNLIVYPTMPVDKFVKKSKNNPLAIMYEDRGPQITFEVVNGYQLKSNQSYKDLRIPIIKRANELITNAIIPITARLAGVFAIDFALTGVSKTTAIKYLLKNKNLLAYLGLSNKYLKNPKHMEIWGDKFSLLKGGTDRHICEALNKKVRAIDFREENPLEFLEGYNIVIWNGKHHLHHGLLEYLQSRHKS